MHAIVSRVSHTLLQRQRASIPCAIMLSLLTGPAIAWSQAPIPVVSPDRARLVASVYADRMGLPEPLSVAQDSFNIGPLGRHYIVATANGGYAFWVNAHSGEVVRYEDRRLLDQVGIGPGQWPAASSADIEVQERLGEFIFPEFAWGEMEYTNGWWRESIGPQVLSGNTLRMVVSNGRVALFSRFHREVAIDARPTLSQEECISSALEWANEWSEHAWLDEGAMGDGTCGRFVVASDAAAVQRLMYPLWLHLADVSRNAWEQLSAREQRRHAVRWYVGVDATTGECVPLGHTGDARLVSSDLPPTLEVAGEPIDAAQTVFPAVVRNGVPYLCVGYLSSLVWPGEVDADGRAASITYADRVWQVTDRSGTASVGGEPRTFQHAPLTIRGYLYLPEEMIEAITGWSITYVEANNTIDLSYVDG